MEEIQAYLEPRIPRMPAFESSAEWRERAERMLCGAALEERAIADLTLRKSYASLKEILEAKLGVNQAPELFTFGLLEAFDIPPLASLVAPRPLAR